MSSTEDIKTEEQDPVLDLTTKNKVQIIVSDLALIERWGQSLAHRHQISFIDHQIEQLTKSKERLIEDSKQFEDIVEKILTFSPVESTGVSPEVKSGDQLDLELEEIQAKIKTEDV